MREAINAIVLTPHGRSGSLFMHSLLDGHNEVISFPTIGFSYHFPSIIYNIPAAVDGFIEKNPDIFDISLGYLGQEGGSVTTALGSAESDDLRVDILEFMRNFKEDELIANFNIITRRDFVIALHFAFAKTVGIDVGGIKFLLIHSHNYDGSHEFILEDFPKMYFIAMVRDPREDWLSWDKVLKLRAKNYSKIRINERNENIQRYAHFIENLFIFSLKLRSNHLKIVDLNRLHLLNKEAMIRLAYWLGLTFQDSLLESTFLGRLWNGNSADRKPISGFSRVKIFHQWPKELDVVDSFVISMKLCNYIIALGYPTVINRIYVYKNSLEKFSSFLKLHLNKVKNIKSTNHNVIRKVHSAFFIRIHIIAVYIAATKILLKDIFAPRRFDKKYFL